MPSRKKSVLLVEDDPSFRKLIKKHLQELEVEVVEVADARSALARLDELAPDLVCLDLILPESNGYEVCAHMKRSPALKDVPVLIMTARASITDRARAEELGISAYLVKPFARAAFLKLARGLLQQAGALAP